MTDAVERTGAHAEAIRDFRRARVLAAAREVFSDRGLEGASVRAIASAAGCTTGAIYSQFSGKEELYAEVLSTSLGSLLGHVNAAVGKAGTDEDCLRSAIAAFFDYYRLRPVELALGLYLFRGVRAVGLGHTLDARLNAQLRDVLDVWSDAIRRVSPEADAELEAASLFTYLVGLLIVEQTRRVRVTLREAEELLDHFADSLIDRLSGQAGRFGR